MILANRMRSWNEHTNIGGALNIVIVVLVDSQYVCVLVNNVYGEAE